MKINQKLSKQNATIALVVFFSILLYLIFGDNIRQAKENTAKSLRIIIEDFGLDVLYTMTIVVFAITLSYWNDFKHWSKRPGYVKGLAGSALFVSIVFGLFSFLRLLGIIKL